MPTVADAAVAGIITLPAGLAEPMPRARPKAPGVIEIVFAACPLQTGHRFSIHIKEVVALPPPAVLGEGDGHDGADVVPPSSEVRDQIIATQGGRIVLSITGMKIGSLRREGLQFLPVHLPVKAGGALR